MILEGDCVALMRDLKDGHFDSVVCDPPYELDFMGRAWDRSGIAFQPSTWREAYRLLKPGGHLLAFGGTRTYHRIAVAIEDAGFEIRDTLAWMYGSGFPKSLDVGKAIDKAAGAEREVIGQRTDGRYAHGFTEEAKHAMGVVGRELGSGFTGEVGQITAPATAEAARWEGWGTALKPAYEPIVVARKPLRGTVAANVLEHGTGAMNIEGCRVRFADQDDERESKSKNRHADFGSEAGGNQVYGDFSMVERVNYDAPGRWPANVALLHDEDCIRLGKRRVPAAKGVSLGDPDGHGIYGTAFPRGDGREVGYADEDGMEEVELYACVPGCPVRTLDDQASAARFFYCAKASRSEREAGLERFDEREFGQSHGALADIERGDERYAEANVGLNRIKRVRNHHPTVKPIEAMRWLVRLVTPPGGRLLDPFAGSGTTGCACAFEGVEFVGLEREPEFVEIARAREEFWARRVDEGARSVEATLRSEAERLRHLRRGQAELF